jgi:hypothetical protein
MVNPKPNKGVVDKLEAAYHAKAIFDILDGEIAIELIQYICGGYKDSREKA